MCIMYVSRENASLWLNCSLKALREVAFQVAHALFLSKSEAIYKKCCSNRKRRAKYKILYKIPKREAIEHSLPQNS